MQDKGLPQNVILKELRSRLEKDLTFKSGRIIGSMCSSPHPLVKKIYTHYLEKNLGDSGLFPAVAEMEKETIEAIGGLLSNPKSFGHIVTGGTEANILALWAAKKMSPKRKSEVIVPASAHCSFDKAGDLLGIEIVKVSLDKKYRADTSAVRKAINSKTIAIVGSAGSTGLGVVDPIHELSEIASERGLYFHVDAAFGGFVLPFIQDKKSHTTSFDFAEPGVCSITVDPHKMGMAPIPAGGILFRSKKLGTTVAWSIPYLAGGKTKHATIAGTRSGASVIAIWSLLKHLGREGYQRIVSRCMRLTHELATEIRNIADLDIITEPTMNIVGLTSRSLDIEKIARSLRVRKWGVAVFPKHIRLVVMPHVKKRHIHEFLEDLRTITRKEGANKGKKNA